MNWFDGIDQVVKYIENNLTKEIDYDEIAKLLGYSSYHCQRLFLLMAGISLADYIRYRRLSVAAEELMQSDEKIIDIALKYGYGSPNSFIRAFKIMHGVTPSDVRKGNQTIKAFPPLAFEVKMKGAEILDYRITEMPSFRIVGEKISTTMQDGVCYQVIPQMWQQVMAENKVPEILALMSAEPKGLLGVSNYNPELLGSEFDYYIAVASMADVPDGMHSLEIPACKWAIFTSPISGAEPIQKLEEKIVMDWLPNSNYEFANAPDIELSFPDGKTEVWLPIVDKK